MEDTTTHNEVFGVFAALAYFYAWQCIHNDVQCKAMIIFIVCWVIILGLTCRVEIPRLGICFITVLTRLCLSTLVLVNARGVNPILVIYSISICQWSVVHPRWS